MSTKRKTACVITSVLTLLVIAFIFYNSLKNADESSKDSGFVLMVLKSILDYLHIDYTAFADMSFIIRKLAHFTEFFMLGASAYFMLFAYGLDKLKRSLISPGIVLLTAISDELIQLTSPGRAGQIRDVIIDFSGGLTAVLILSLIFYIIDRKRQKKIA